MPTAGIKGSDKSGKSSDKPSRSRNRRRRSSKPAADPLATESLGEARVPQPSIFDGEDDKDPFDIDLSAATYSEDEE